MTNSHSLQAPLSGTFPGWHLAQFNYAKARFEPSDPRMFEFVAALDRINTLADQTPGFVWRLHTEAGHSIDVRPWPEDPLRLVTLSVWESIGALARYAYSGEHAKMMAHRHEWFEPVPPGEPYLVMWWVPAGRIPTVTESVEKLKHLEAHGSTPCAFAFSSPFDPNGNPMRENLKCPLPQVPSR